MRQRPSVYWIWKRSCFLECSCSKFFKILLCENQSSQNSPGGRSRTGGLACIACRRPRNSLTSLRRVKGVMSSHRLEGPTRGHMGEVLASISRSRAQPFDPVLMLGCTSGRGTRTYGALPSPNLCCPSRYQSTRLSDSSARACYAIVFCRAYRLRVTQGFFRRRTRTL